MILRSDKLTLLFVWMLMASSDLLDYSSRYDHDFTCKALKSELKCRFSYTLMLGSNLVLNLSNSSKKMYSLFKRDTVR